MWDIIKGKIKEYRFLIGVFALVILMFFCVPVDKISKTYIDNINPEFGGIGLDSGVVVTQKFHIENTFNTITFQLGNNGNYTDGQDDKICVELYNMDGKELGSWSFKRKDISEKTTKTFSAKEYCTPGGYYFNISAPDTSYETPIILWANHTAELAHFKANDDEFDNTLSFSVSCKYKNYFVYIAAVIFLITLLCWYFIGRKFESYEVGHILAFLLIFGVGLCYILLIAPFSAPDENAHYTMVYKLSNLILGKDKIYIDYRYAPSLNRYTTHSNSADSFFSVIEEIKEVSLNKYTTELVGGVRDSLFPLPYIVPALFTSLCRALGTSFLTLYYGCRVINLLMFTLVSSLAIKVTPKLKYALLMFCLSPIVLQQAGAITYDWLILSSSFLFFALILNYSFGEKMIGIKEILILLLVSVCFIPYKVVYVVMLLCVFVIPKDKWKYKIPKAVIIPAGIVSLAVVGFVVYKAAGVILHDGAKSSFSFIYFFDHPLECFRVFTLTVYEDLPLWLTQMFGRVLSGLSLYIPIWIVLVMMFLCVIGSIFDFSDNSFKFNKKQKRIFEIVIVGVVLLVMGSFFMLTERVETKIWGLQGRYYIPVVPLIMMCIYSSVDDNEGVIVEAGKYINQNRLMKIMLVMQFLVIHAVGTAIV